MPPASDPSAATVDAFSTRAARPLVVLTANRADDLYRHRFTAAHELGHLVLHGDTTGDSRQEKEADTFAAESASSTWWTRYSGRPAAGSGSATSAPAESDERARLPTLACTRDRMTQP
ncbi:ImmA/IrrE family metallo-endopeptidase [Streptomyces sp. NPDC058417]|uniref:ImmA/IrrE family metallo-endopeptidase n=1 Tax=unclassified Streptomyces TaxID=2593676 RepID=UPI00365F2C29